MDRKEMDGWKEIDRWIERWMDRDREMDGWKNGRTLDFPECITRVKFL